MTRTYTRVGTVSAVLNEASKCIRVDYSYHVLYYMYVLVYMYVSC